MDNRIVEKLRKILVHITDDDSIWMMLSKEKVLKNPRMSQALLGVSKQEFKTLRVPFSLSYLSLKEEIKHN